MWLTERIQLKGSPALSALCHKAKNLYNLANYTIRQRFFQDGYWIRFEELNSIVMQEHVYKALPSKTSDLILWHLDKVWKSFFRKNFEYARNPQEYHGRPRPPRYKPKNGKYIVIFDEKQYCIKDGYLHFPNDILPPIKTRIKSIVKRVRIIPRGNHYFLELVYQKDPRDLKLNRDHAIAIDLGLNNLATVVNNVGLQPFIIKGGVIKSINQFYNKEWSRLSSIKDKQQIKGLTRRLHRLNLKRQNKIRDFFHKTSKVIVDYCIRNDIGTIIIGYNKDWKHRIAIGRRSNQNFVNVPFLQLVNLIQYKFSLIGNSSFIVEEFFTSRCSFLDVESVGPHKTYAGERICRGLFRSSDGTIINADVNGGYNIGRKAVPNAFRADGIEGVGLHPYSIAIH